MVGYAVDQAPRPILWVFPNVALCKNFSSERWLPFCRESAAIARRIPRNSDGSFDEDRFNLVKQEFDRCTMNLVGAGSAANVRSYPIAILVLDEIDVIDEGTRRECLDRIKGKVDFKVLQSSTPIAETGGIWQEFMAGDRRRYYMPCPHCEEMIILRWKNEKGENNLKWDEGAKQEDGTWTLSLVQKTAKYICENCGGTIEDKHKTKMLRNGQWEPTSSAAEDGVRSYHLNSLYSPILTFGRIAVEFLKSKGSVEAMKTFVNGWLAEPWRPDVGSVDPEKFRALEQDYERGTIKGKYRILAVDVQRNYFVWVIRGFDVDGQSWLIDNGTAPSFTDFSALIDRYEVSYGIVDTGYRTQEIYEEIHRHRPFWFGAKGWDKLPQSFRLTKIDPFSVTPQGKKRASKRAISILHVNKEIWQQEMLAKRVGSALNWWVYQKIDREYVRQMLATNLVEKVNKAGRVKREWAVEGHRQDHYWDCETYALALSHAFGLGGAVMRGAGAQHKTSPKSKPAKQAVASQGDSFWAG